jgi:hypothetical protein
MKRIATGLALLALVGCATHRLPASQTYLIQWYWHQAQAALASYTHGASYQVSHGLVRWRTFNGPFTCGGGPPTAGGCFYATPNGLQIDYIAYMPHIIEHEACHAILFVLNNPKWGSHCHSLYPTEAYEP